MNTVKYIKETYTATGHVYYTKQCYIKDGDASYWGKPRPITESTFRKAEREGKPCFILEIGKKPAKIIDFYMIWLRKGKHTEWQKTHSNSR